MAVQVNLGLSYGLSGSLAANSLLTGVGVISKYGWVGPENVMSSASFIHSTQ